MTKLKPFTKLHKDGTVWAKGLVDEKGQPQGHWQWFRKDGSLLRSGSFEAGEQRSEWITYSEKGKPHKVTNFPEIGSDLPITSGPAQRALSRAGIKNLADLKKWNLDELAKLHGMGPKAIRTLQETIGVN